jgi:hypothetical protein
MEPERSPIRTGLGPKRSESRLRKPDDRHIFSAPLLTIVPVSVTQVSISLTKDAAGEGTLRRLGRVRCLRAGPYTPFSGGSGIILPAL